MKKQKSKPTHSQHYVWQHYLKSWVKDKRVCCLRKQEGKIFCTGTQAIAHETFFYKAERLTANDLKYLDVVISKDGSEELRDVHKSTVALFQLSFTLQDQIKLFGLSEIQQIELHAELDEVSKTIGESMQTVVERDMLEHIEDLRRGRCGFYTNVDKAMKFIHFISHQFIRTPTLKQINARSVTNIPGFDPKRTWLIESNIYAVNIAFSIFSNYKKYSFIFLENSGKVPFITGDQPVINLNTKHDNEISMYYPLSPSLALIFHKNEEIALRRRVSVTEAEVESYNARIFKNSFDQVYSSDEAYLRDINARLIA